MNIQNWSILKHLDPNLLKEIRLAYVFGTSGSEAFIITRDNKVFAVGTNKSSCLGLGDTTSILTAKENSFLSKIDIKSVAAAVDQTRDTYPGGLIGVTAVTKDGTVYGWGTWYKEGYTDSIKSPNSVFFPHKVKEVACGSSHCVALCYNGQVYSWGANDESQLGQSAKSRSSYHSDPSLVGGDIDGKCVIEIACGSKFSLALLDVGTVLAWGSNQFGQIGVNRGANHNHCCPVREPSPLPLSKVIKIQKIACGSDHSLALTRNGELYRWGRGNDNTFQPHMPSLFEWARESSEPGVKCRFVDIAASYLHDLSVAVSETNEIIFWGKSVTGQTFPPTLSNCKSIDEVFYHHARAMHKPLILPEKDRLTVADSLLRELNNEATSDLIIKVVRNERYIHAHKAILMMRSNYFKTMLPKWLKKNDKMVETGGSYNVISAYLNYVYSDELHVQGDLDLAIELFKTAEKFKEDDFKVLCEQHIRSLMTIEKVAELYAVTRKLSGAQSLNQFCLTFALNHAREVMESDGYKNWDMETMKVYLAEYIKMKES